MLLRAELIATLLTAIETDSLVFLCGAGLSIPEPSFLLSAQRVSQICYDKMADIEPLNPAFRADIDLLAGFFHARGDFERTFIKLVPWNELVGPPNQGHAAVADLLICRGARAALTANFDTIIESWAEERKVFLRGALTGQEAEDFAIATNPLIKFHGCMHRAQSETLWTTGQLNEQIIKERVLSCSQWMALNLPGKHLVVVGFWTDWGYLNNVLANAFTTQNASSVTVIDPRPAADLADKAPNLWSKLNSLSHTFEHVPVSGADALHELRIAYSRRWAKRFYALGKSLAEANGEEVSVPEPFEALSCEDLYDLRRDAQGFPYTRAANQKLPVRSSEQAAYLHVALLNAGAKSKGAWLEYNGHDIRVVNGGGRGLAEVQAEYKEPRTIVSPNIVICAGAKDFGVPARIIAPGRGASTVRPLPGGDARWLTLEEAQLELDL